MPKTDSESTIRFFSEPFNKVSTAGTPDVVIAKIPASVKSKTELLQTLSKELRFPLYFGWNWDAVSDCLRDLHWLKGARRVRIVHEALPFPPGWKKRKLYLNVLQEAVQSWNANPGIQLEVLFPETTKREVEALLSKA